MIRNVPGEAVIACVLSMFLLGWLAARDDFPVRQSPPLPAFLTDVDGASIGTEYGPSGAFWSIDQPTATITITNTAAVQASVMVSFTVLDGPCGTGQELSLTGDAQRDIIVAPATATVVELGPATLGAFERFTVQATPLLPACGPFGDDPRSIAFQLHGLTASTGA